MFKLREIYQKGESGKLDLRAYTKDIVIDSWSDMPQSSV